MKLKRVIILSLLLAVLTIGAVSAVEDNATDMGILTDDCSQDMLEEPVDGDLIGDGEPNSENINEDGISVIVYDEIFVDDNLQYASIHFANIRDDSYLNGTVSYSIDDNAPISKEFKAEDMESYYYFGLNETPDYGFHKINFTYQKNGVANPYNIVKDVEATYTFMPYIEDYDSYVQYIDYDSPGYMFFELPSDSSGVVYATMGGKSYKSNVNTGFSGYIAVNAKNFKIGTYIMKATFKDSSKKYPERTINVTVNIVPKVYSPFYISSDEDDSIVITGAKGTKIKATLYKEDEKTVLTTVSGTTEVTVPVKKFLKNGENILVLNYSAGNYTRSESFEINYFKNSKKISASVAKTGDSVTVTVKGPKDTLDNLQIYLDGEETIMESLNLKKDQFKKKFSSLSIGKHKIKVVNYGKKYSNTFYVTVKAKDKVSLSLKTVKVKKSAKKIVLKATLKLNKKAKKGLKVTFKFNGKKFTAKTNKKGVAKVAVKKKFLKKLKVGKKVKYLAKYSFKTVKKTAKVKR